QFTVTRPKHACASVHIQVSIRRTQPLYSDTYSSRRLRNLHAYRALRGEQVIIVSRAGCFVLKTILQFQLSMRRETVTSCDIDAAQILTPANIASCTIADGPKELLVPAERTKELRREFIFRLKIIGERVSIAYTGNLETRFINFRPQLKMVPGKAGILP